MGPYCTSYLPNLTDSNLTDKNRANPTIIINRTQVRTYKKGHYETIPITVPTVVEHPST